MFDRHRSFSYNGEGWTEQPPWKQENARGLIYDLDGIDEQHVWVAGDDGIHFFDGVSWHRQLDDIDDSFAAVHAFAHDNVWAVTYSGVVYLFDGVSWEPQTPPLDFPSNQVVDIWATAPDSVWLLNSEFIWLWDGQSWVAKAEPAARNGFDSLAGIKQPDVWAVAGPYAVLFDGGPGTEQVFASRPRGVSRWAGRSGSQ